MHLAIETHRAEIEGLCRAFAVTRLELYGSAARGDDFDIERSDADFLVEFGPTDTPPFQRFFGFRAALAEVLGRPVDLTSIGAVRNPHLKTAIDRDRTHVFAA